MFKFQHTYPVYILVLVLLISVNGYAQKPSTSPTPAETPSQSGVQSVNTAAAPVNDKLTRLAKRLRKQGFHIDSLLNDPRFKLYDGIADHFRQSAEKKSPDLEDYKRILGFAKKKDQIVDFMHAHSAELEKAEKKYGIPKYVISAIIGIESDFGKNTGSYNPFNTYVSMYAENYRREFAYNQLKHLLIFVRNRNLDVFDLKSSYAGAMAFGQFIPYSMNKWFIGDDILDMDNNIMSVANYLSYFKKRTGSVRKAVLRYNPSNLYTKAVLELANAAQKKSKAS
ncbi:MAG TPA: lytic murein transglycosylase [Balneolaceae bacterium]|nr:lytic murein transglycosylase [Balneolaceae bacterium]